MKVYGPLLRLAPESTTAVARIKHVEPLPSPDAPAHRRRRNTVCACLTINGETQTVATIDKQLHELKGRAGTQAEIKCFLRPGVLLEAEFAKDVCLSSWSKQCLFKAENQEAA